MNPIRALHCPAYSPVVALLGLNSYCTLVEAKSVEYGMGHAVIVGTRSAQRSMAQIYQKSNKYLTKIIKNIRKYSK